MGGEGWGEVGVCSVKRECVGVGVGVDMRDRAVGTITLLSLHSHSWLFLILVLLGSLSTANNRILVTIYNK